MKIGLKTLKKFDETITWSKHNNFKKENDLFVDYEYNKRILDYFGICPSEHQDGDEILSMFSFLKKKYGRNMSLEEIETIEEMVDYIQHNCEKFDCSTIRGHCESAWSYGHEISEDSVMIELGIGEF